MRSPSLLTHLGYEMRSSLQAVAAEAAQQYRVTMDPVSSLPLLGIVLVALATAVVIVRVTGAPPAQGRFTSIDGLRGYLALCVFGHHSAIWYFYLRSGLWELPDSHLYTHCGQSSVALFFMITGFLFFSKLLNARAKGVDFGRLLLGRVMRLTPLYWLAILILFAIVGVLSGGELRQPLLKLAWRSVRWLGFTILEAPDLNAVRHTYVIIAGVTWSLAYEWFFYLSLPVIALLVGVTVPRGYLALGFANLVALAIWGPDLHHLSCFIGGIVAAYLVRRSDFQRFAGTHVASAVVLGLLALVVVFFPTAYGALPLALLSLAFALIAGGATLFGVLSHPVSRALGEFTYGLYLLHGLLLFVTFTFIVPRSQGRHLDAQAHWLIAVGLTPLLVLASYAAFRFVERPALESTPRVEAWLRARFARGLPAQVDPARR